MTWLAPCLVLWSYGSRCQYPSTVSLLTPSTPSICGNSRMLAKTAGAGSVRRLLGNRRPTATTTLVDFLGGQKRGPTSAGWHFIDTPVTTDSFAP